MRITRIMEWRSPMNLSYVNFVTVNSPWKRNSPVFLLLCLWFRGQLTGYVTRALNQMNSPRQSELIGPIKFNMVCLMCIHEYRRIKHPKLIDMAILEFSPTWSCVSLARRKASSEWKFAGWGQILYLVWQILVTLTYLFQELYLKNYLQWITNNNVLNSKEAK